MLGTAFSVSRRAIVRLDLAFQYIAHYTHFIFSKILGLIWLEKQTESWTISLQNNAYQHPVERLAIKMLAYYFFSELAKRATVCLEDLISCGSYLSSVIITRPIQFQLSFYLWKTFAACRKPNWVSANSRSHPLTQLGPRWLYLLIHIFKFLLAIKLSYNNKLLMYNVNVTCTFLVNPKHYVARVHKEIERLKGIKY